MKGGVLFVAAVLVVLTGTFVRAAEQDDLAVARGWLAAAAKDAAALESSTFLPFTYRTTNKIKKCERAVRNHGAFSKWALCFRKDQKLLLDEVGAGAKLEAASVQNAEPKGLRAVANKIPGEGRWLFAFINGDGITFTFLFKVTGGTGAAKVTAIVLEEEVENG